ncbi:MAG: histidine phosphatase family protein [Methylobacteriaceae bacterium]|nr:histidine phosphatase family protein [Methylobacteriaceae bacterium]
MSGPDQRLFFVRHGETDWNRTARLQGQQDVPLNALGRAQAADAARRLLTLVQDPGTLDYVASPLGRTRETMEILREALGLPREGYRLEPRFVELTFGRWEGLTWREVRRHDPAGAREREADKWGYVPPGGESYAQLETRVLPALAECRSDSVIVAHGGVARAFLRALAQTSEQDAPRVDIWQGRVLVFEAGRHRWV